MTVVDGKERKIDGYALERHWRISQVPHYRHETRLNFDALDREYLHLRYSYQDEDKR